jgi:pyruvate dehydrogenase E2 component (dihydrolipoamide acetyltransferase)
MADPTRKASVTPRRETPEDLVRDLEALGIVPGTYDFEPLDAMRRAIARRTAESFREAPHFGLQAVVEVDKLIAARCELQSKTSVNDWLVRAAAVALRETPRANATYMPDALILHRHADVAVAVATEFGLVTPIVRRAEEKSVVEISQEILDLAARARRKRLLPPEYMGGTFTLSNLGMFGVRSFTSVLNPPQGCILSVGEATKQYVFRAAEPQVATVILVTLTCDHRVVDGAIGAQWLQTFRRLVEQPSLLLQGSSR